MQAANRTHDEVGLSLLVQRIPVLPFDASALRERRRDALDRMVAAHAVSDGATLVTNIEADFEAYPGLVLENWARGP
jgi:tRNA(fMet)-specific endonuclease VapC